MVTIAKAFGPTQALREATFEIVPGEVHAIVGENGSGKSTLMKILSGVHAPDSGTIEISGESVTSLASPKDAQEHGITTVFQEVLIADARSVLENVWLGVDGPLRTPIGFKEKRERAGALLEELRGEKLSLDTLLEDLPLSDRQACCIVRALLREPKLLILDEATSALDIATRDRLFAMMRRLSAEGVGIIFISHRMDEISEVADRITVMRNGRTVGTLERGKWTPQALVSLMTGADELTEHAREREAKPPDAEVLLSASLQLRSSSRPFEVNVRAGDLIGVAGLEGHGQDEFIEALFGGPVFAGGVMRHEGGREVRLGSQRQSAKHGVVYVPRDRSQSLFRWMSIRENFAMPTLGQDSKAGILRVSSTRARLRDYVGRLNIVLGHPEDAITTLSGGNQQKVIVARWLAANPRVLILNDPTRGIDIGAKRDLYALLVQLASEGVGIVMLSTEVDEHIELMDRVLVFREHELFAEIDRKDLSRNSLVSAFFGQSEDESSDA